MHMTVIHVKATRIEDLGNGVFRVEMPGYPLTNDDRKVIERLYPTLAEKAYMLLDQESLINSVANPAEIQAPEIRGKEKGPVKKRVLGDSELLP